mmetsp:Transcript_147349/g.270669  ORF Transcript_147349/g.270669 Transcript_147349/m.270669 type:complete len:241 (-) Transcript_147349:54-776(-)
MADEIVVHAEDIKREGFLLKKSKVLKTWRKRWFVLTPQYLCAFKTESDQQKVTEFIYMNECSSVKSVDQETGKENSFCVITPARTFFLIASSPAEKEVWMDDITNHCMPLLFTMGTDTPFRRCVSPLAAIEEDGDATTIQDSETSLTSAVSPTALAAALTTKLEVVKDQRCCLCLPEGLLEPCGVCSHSPAVCVFLAVMRHLTTPEVERNVRRERRAGVSDRAGTSDHSNDLVRNALLDL